MMRVTGVTILDGFKLELCFSDGTTGEVDLSGLSDKGVFRKWKQPGAFAGVRIGSSGELVWGDYADLCPDALYLQATGKPVEVLFPSLGPEAVNA